MKIRDAIKRAYVLRYIEAEKARKRLRKLSRKLSEQEQRACELEALERITDMNRKGKW